MTLTPAEARDWRPEVSRGRWCYYKNVETHRAGNRHVFRRSSDVEPRAAGRQEQDADFTLDTADFFYVQTMIGF